MKRSEMLTQIKDELKHELWGYFSKNSEHDDALVEAGVDINDLAEKILVRIEQAGMTPPPHSKATLANGLEVRLNNWEPECNNCGTDRMPIQKMGGLVCSECRKVIE